MLYKVDNQYPLKIEDRYLKDPQKGSYFYTFKYERHRIELNTLCWRACFQRIGPVRSVIEWCGGIGICSAMIRGILKPRSHSIYEIDPIACHHLKRVFPGAHVIEADSTQHDASVEAEVVIADFWALTILQFGTVERIFKARTARWIILTDAAVYRLHLNAPHYTRRLRQKITDLNSYVNAYSPLVETFGYHLGYVAYHHGSAKLLFQRGGRKQQFLMEKFPREPRTLLNPY